MRGFFAVIGALILAGSVSLHAQSWSGTGYRIIDFTPLNAPALVHVTGNAGGTDFAVYSYATTGSFIDLLVGWTSDPYDGIRPLNFDETNAMRFIVYADDAWHIEILPLSSAHAIAIPGSYTGTGDDVLALTGGVPDLASIMQNDPYGGFMVYAYDSQAHFLDSVVGWTNGPFFGIVPVDRRTAYFEIRSYSTTYPWMISLTGIPGPSITQIISKTSRPGSVARIHGTGFSLEAMKDVVYFGTKKAKVTRAKTTSLKVTIPRLPKGEIDVYVIVNGQASRRVQFTVR